MVAVAVLPLTGVSACRRAVRFLSVCVLVRSAFAWVAVATCRRCVCLVGAFGVF